MKGPLFRSLGQIATRSIAQSRPKLCQQGLSKSPVVIPSELMNAFHHACKTPASFGNDITLGDHCLQVATEVLLADWIPDVYRRDMVVMSLFHDVYYKESKEDHGSMVAKQLDGRIHPHVSSMLSHHTILSPNHEYEDEALDQFAVSTRQLLDAFAKVDCLTVTPGRRRLAFDFFEREGFFCSEERSEQKTESWLSPNGNLVWAAPSMWIERTPILLAIELGLFEAAGLPSVDLMVTDGGPELLKHVSHGKAHVGEIGLFPFLANMDSASPSPAKLVGSTFIQQLDHYLASGSSNIKSLKDLRGRRVGVLSRGSCDSYLLRAMLLQAGIEPSEVEAVPLGSLYGSLEVLQKRHVDATFLVEPALSDGEEKGFAHVLTKASALYPRFQWGALFASDHLLEKSPETLRRILAVYKDACYKMHSAIMDYQHDITESDLEVRHALSDISRKWFRMKESTFLRALRRDADQWQLDWKCIDYDGAKVCADIQDELGVFRSQKPSIQNAFSGEF
jgi:ABC-type nitrate/sulfonate/bicarbonate transport system substrate-binding protein